MCPDPVFKITRCDKTWFVTAKSMAHALDIWREFMEAKYGDGDWSEIDPSSIEQVGDFIN